ncbi:MAG: pyruvate kinase [Chitinispirillales bacterium]|jgi:pyruvate kinase|nr:pyruvate kinase [Chitinispirillales bacterium]
MTPQLKKTRIVATLGPASGSADMIKALLREGVNVFRFNFSHGDHKSHIANLRAVYEVSRELDTYPALLADLQGPKIRTGKTEDNATVTLQTGWRVIITSEDVVCTESIISVDHPTLAQEIKAGQEIAINDGLIRLKVEQIDSGNKIHCIVTDGGTYSSRKGVNLPNILLSIPSVTEKDKKDLEFILANQFHYVALSFVRTARDLRELKTIMAGRRPDLKIIAKIEKPEAAQNIDSILEECDGIMVARGDLGVEAYPQHVPIIQKDLIYKANMAAKEVIVATQMLESMIENPVPTRAEATDVANAIFDGTDAVMLSGETAVGKYPKAAVQMMTQIAQAAESSGYYPKDIHDLSILNGYPPYALCEAAAYASKDLGLIPIIVITMSGETAHYLSKIRCQSPIFAFSPQENIVHQLSLTWNVQALQLDFGKGDITDILHRAEQMLMERKLVNNEELVAVLAGNTPVKGATSFLRIKLVGEV